MLGSFKKNAQIHADTCKHVLPPTLSGLPSMCSTAAYKITVAGGSLQPPDKTSSLQPDPVQRQYTTKTLNPFPIVVAEFRDGISHSQKRKERSRWLKFQLSEFSTYLTWKLP
jgi:hypothetical protein